MAADLLALTVRQPFATAIIERQKPIENRESVFFDVGADGRWLALHAGAALYPSFQIGPRSTLDKLVDYQNACGWLHGLWPSHPDVDEMPRGALLGMVHICRVWDYRRSANLAAAVRWLGPWATGPVCVQIDEALALPSPIPCKGALGLWRVPAEHAEPLLALVPRA